MDIDEVFSTSSTTYGDFYKRDKPSIPHYNEIRAPYPTPHYMYFNEIRLSIFCIVAACGGFPCLIWAFYSVHLQRKASGRVSSFIILLLLNDLMQLLMYPYIASQILSLSFYPTSILFLLVVCLKIIGLHLQPLVALGGVLILKYPIISPYIFSWPCYIMISIIIHLIPSMCLLGLYFGGPYVEHMCVYLIFGSTLLPACLLVATGIIIYKAPPTAASTPVTDSRPGAMVFTVSLVTLLVLYLPSVMLLIVKIHFHNHISVYLTMTLCLVSFTVVSEPLLCVLVCTQNLSAQTKQTRIELKSEQTSV